MSKYNKTKSNYRKVKTCLSCAFSSYKYSAGDSKILIMCDRLIDEVAPDALCRMYAKKVE